MAQSSLSSWYNLRLGSKSPSISVKAKTSSTWWISPFFPLCSPFGYSLIVLGASGRPRRSLQAHLRTYSEPCGRQCEPILEVLHRRQHALLLERYDDSVWCHPCPQRKVGGWHGAECASLHCSAPVRTHLCRDAQCRCSCSRADGISLVFCRASLFFGASQNIRGERVKDLGWEPRPVVLEDWADEGITSALASLPQ